MFADYRRLTSKSRGIDRGPAVAEMDRVSVIGNALASGKESAAAGCGAGRASQPFDPGRRCSVFNSNSSVRVKWLVKPRQPPSPKAAVADGSDTGKRLWAYRTVGLQMIVVG
ncbi:hypothetical protein KCP71_02570 [Salmonella enterica subsp. enterica]|nr:hypothetical protein KCP71_02570 [Salmonella enterica subsp. enterica]